MGEAGLGFKGMDMLLVPLLCLGRASGGSFIPSPAIRESREGRS